MGCCLTTQSPPSSHSGDTVEGPETLDVAPGHHAFGKPFVSDSVHIFREKKSFSNDTAPGFVLKRAYREVTFHFDFDRRGGEVNDATGRIIFGVRGTVTMIIPEEGRDLLF